MVRGLIVKYRVLDDWINKERQTEFCLPLNCDKLFLLFLGMVYIVM